MTTRNVIETKMSADPRIRQNVKRLLPPRPVETLEIQQPQLRHFSSNEKVFSVAMASSRSSSRDRGWTLIRKNVLEESRPRNPKLNKWSFLQKTNSSSNLFRSSSRTSEVTSRRSPSTLTQALCENERISEDRCNQKQKLLKQRSMEFIDVFKKFEGSLNDARDFWKISKEREQVRKAQLAKKKEEEAFEKCFCGLDEVRLLLKQTEIDFKQIRVKCAIIKHV